MSWIFLINVPIGVIAGILCWVNLSSRETATRALPIDTVGLILLAVWVGSLQIMLDTGKDADWFASTTIVRGGDRRRNRVRRLQSSGN